MKIKILLSLFLFVYISFLGAQNVVKTSLRVKDLTVEYKINPEGLDIAKPRFAWILEAEGKGRFQTTYQILVASSEKKLNSLIGDIWDSGKVSSGKTNQIEYQGKPLESNTTYYWKVKVWDENGEVSRWSSNAHWSMGLLKFHDWKGLFISHDVGYDKTDKYDSLYLPPARYLRKSFTINKKIKRAKVFSTAMGLYEMHLNGNKVGEDLFLPGWTDYDERLYYQTYDITNQLIEGENAIGAIIADGWYAGYIGYALLVRIDKVREFYGVNPSFMCQIVIDYEDGTKEIIPTDLSWKVNTGPIIEADILMGESYDARLEHKNWTFSNFDDSNWHKPKVYTYPNGRFGVHPGNFVHKVETLKSKRITEPQKGVYVFDLGKNIAGIVKLKVEGPKGTKIKLRYGEILKRDGNVQTENLRLARATDTYILKGEGVETWQPKFTYHGFQFVEVTGLPEKPSIDAITGIALSSVNTNKSTFNCSNELNNTLYKNIQTTQKANYFEVPTDCPQRDERLGWTGDAHTFMRSATYMADVAPFMTKYLKDLDDAQRWYGAYPNFAPFPYSRPHQYSPAWMDAGIIIPYNMYKVYNDTRILEQLYSGMEKFMDFQAEASTNFLRPPAGNNWGDWLSVNEDTSHEYVAAAFYGFDAKLMIEIAEALNKINDVAKYTALYENIKKAFVKKYILDNGFTTEDTQTTYALALYFDLYPNQEIAQKGADRLAEKIKDNGYTFSTGFVGTKHIMPSLSKYGYHDLAFKLFKQTKYPSWGFSIENGSTSIWERWNSYTKDEDQNSNINAAMNSFSHYAFGSVAEWMFMYAVGIDTEDAGYKNIIIKPAITKEMDFIEGSYKCINGLIKSSWKWKKNTVVMDVTIPANTKAKIYVPTTSIKNLKVNNQKLDKQSDVSLLQYKDELACIQVGSGKYSFSAINKK
ncbi:MAG: family 78 glycoside hydrolase catalytic domain [Algibacter sp.]|uniref:alpha-L-rhamnosidase n=1 Tax=Algibacter sp. TaxID=1872428 RepID=UPI00262A5F33|nr:alpha-L-rhamnosidase [Algibacter sp.]MDG1729325.1 family 78 glycoside hydrolase catalytic domain [Algibacter sp.]MDG2179044.1 family 78 glycoside hydrolase catalytic domain [Algibacter sp.]